MSVTQADRDAAAAYIAECKELLICEIIAMYHTTRLAGLGAAEHILTKPCVQHAFARYEAATHTTKDATP